MYQQTIQRSCSLTGTGLHSGQTVTITAHPAAVDSGIVFIRTDLPGKPHIPARIEHLHSRMRCSCISIGTAEVFTTEHLLATCYAMGIDNLLVEIDGSEVPGMDGSALPFYETIHNAGIQAQDKEASPITITDSIQIKEDKASLQARHYDGGLHLEYRLEYDVSFLPPQYLALDINDHTFARYLAPARTFVLRREVEQLQKLGLGKGATTQNTLVLDENGCIIDNTFRFPDEFVRHKMLDLLGDLALLSVRLNAHISAVRSGHTLNARLAQEIMKASSRRF